MTALVVLCCTASALVLTAVAQWVDAEINGARMQEWRERR